MTPTPEHADSSGRHITSVLPFLIPMKRLVQPLIKTRRLFLPSSAQSPPKPHDPHSKTQETYRWLLLPMLLRKLLRPHAIGITLYRIYLIRLASWRASTWRMRRRCAAGAVSLFNAACAGGAEDGGEGVVACVRLDEDESC